MALTTREVVIALTAAAIVGMLHFGAHSFFGDPAAFEQAGVMETGIVVFLGVLGALILADDE